MGSILLNSTGTLLLTNEEVDEKQKSDQEKQVLPE
jgi:hypothetical protein